MSSPHRFLPVVLLVPYLACAGADTPSDAARYAFDSDEIEEFLETELPPTQPKGTFAFKFEPNFNDTLERDFVRVPMRLFYGFGENVDAYIGVAAFLANPQGNESANGINAILLGTEYRWHERFNPFEKIRISTGLDVSLSVRDTPEEVTDGLHRIEPFITFSRRADWNPKVVYFLNAGLDLAFEDTGIDTALPAENDEPALNLSPGLYTTWKRFLVVGKLTYENDVWSGGETETLFFEPGLKYAVPRKATGWLLPGQFFVGGSVRRGFIDAEDETDYTFFVEWDFDFFGAARELLSPDEEAP